MPLKHSKLSFDSNESVPWQDGGYFQCSLVDLTVIGNERNCSEADDSDVSSEYDAELSPLDTGFLCDDHNSLPEEQLCLRHQNASIRHGNVCICQQSDEREWSRFPGSHNSFDASKHVEGVSDEKVKMRPVKKLRIAKGLRSKLTQWFSLRMYASNRKSAVLVCNMADSDQLRWSCLF